MTTDDPKQPVSPKVQRERSPAYPFMSLKTAFERVIAFELKFGRHGSPMNKAGIAWGYKGDSSQASQTLSALKYFGLVEYTGPTNDRVVVLTDDARNYMRAQQASTKAQIAAHCALRPKAMQTYWARWGADRPIDEIALDQLIIKDDFTTKAAKTFLRVYDDTIAFAGLRNIDKIEEATEGADESGGLLDEDDVNTSPPPPPKERIESSPMQIAPAPKAMPSKGIGMRQEIFTVTEGDVTIQWPEHMSADSLQDFKDWLRILERKITRSAIPPAPQVGPEPTVGDEGK